MRDFHPRQLGKPVLIILLIAGLASAGCSATGSALRYLSSPYTATGLSDTTVGGPTTIDRTTGSGLTGGGRAGGDACEETQSRKFVTISMRNQSDDYIHYFLHFIAYVQSDTYPDGAVCPDDISLYTSFGYTSVPEGACRAVGHFAIDGPALVYFHRNGSFQGAAGSGLESGIAPAQGTSATYDNFFNASGAQVPIPNWILFHNPGTTTEGRALKYSISDPSPCEAGIVTADPNCEQDSWYYVDENGVRAGSLPARGDLNRAGSYVRFPSEIQGSGCTCGFGNEAWSTLAPAGATARDVLCNEFLRGGRVEYVFIRDDTEPPFPQLVWRVTDTSGSEAHDFDERANVP
jgi:hypothetical protein